MTPREIVLEAFRAAIARVDLAGRVASALDEGTDGPFVVVAAGKAATTMLAGVRAFSVALAVIPRGAAAPSADPRVTVIEAAHPLPDDASVRAAEAALALAASAAPEERLFLVSGGASSLLCAPSVGLTLERKRDVVRALLAADASIDEVNTVRRHLSRVKGGGLARACGARARRTLIASDVLSNAPHAVGSGPSVPDPTTMEDARRIAAARGLGELPFVETWKREERCAVVASPLAFAALVAEELGARGHRARAGVATEPDVESLAQRHARVAAALAPGEAAVFAAEPALRVTVRGASGGRCTHLAARMASLLPAGTTFAALATDGVDGASGTGGAVVDVPLPGAALALARFATGPLHLAAGTAVPGGPTGINFADLHVILRT